MKYPRIFRPKAFRIGLLAEREYDEIAFEAQPWRHHGAFFGDGVTDHLAPDEEEEYYRGRLAALLRKCGDLAPHEIVEKVFEDLDRFNVGRFDDQTLIVIRVSPNVPLS